MLFNRLNCNILRLLHTDTTPQMSLCNLSCVSPFNWKNCEFTPNEPLQPLLQYKLYHIFSFLSRKRLFITNIFLLYCCFTIVGINPYQNHIQKFVTFSNVKCVNIWYNIIVINSWFFSWLSIGTKKSNFD